MREPWHPSSCSLSPTQTTTAPTVAARARAVPPLSAAPDVRRRHNYCALLPTEPPPCPLLPPRYACVLLLPASWGLGGVALGRWDGSNATAARRGVGGAAPPPPNTTGTGTPCVRRTPSPTLLARCCLQAGGWGVALGRSGGSNATARRGTRGEDRRWARCHPERGLASRRRRRCPTCLYCTWALQPASWKVGASE